MQLLPERFAGMTPEEIRAAADEIYRTLGYDEKAPDGLVEELIERSGPVAKAVEDVNLKPTEAMANAAKRGLKLRKEHGRGGTEVGVARARDISNRKELSPSTVKRMKSFFARHEVDLDAPAAKEGNEGYPSAGLIAWLLWGGDPGKKWAESKVDQLNNAVGKMMSKRSKDDKEQSEPAKPSERREGSDRNKPGSASGSRGGIEISESTEKALKNKVEKHNEKHGEKEGKKVTLGMLKSVYRRGAGAFSTSHRPGMGRAQWAMARVNAFLYLVRTGKPKDSKYTTDNDLLPKGHPKRSGKKAADNCGTGAGGFKEDNTCATGSAAADKSGPVLDKDGVELVDNKGRTVPRNPDGTITLYHGTTEEGARKIAEEGFISKENTGEAFFSTVLKGVAGYGDGTIVEVRVDPNKVRIDDMVPMGIFDRDDDPANLSVAVKIEDISTDDLVPFGAEEHSKDTMTSPGVLRVDQPEGLEHNEQTDSDAFKQWFGEGPQHADGEPVQFYHGTKRDFDTLRGSQRYDNSPFFLTTDPKFASTWPEGSGGLREPGEEAARQIAEIEERTEQLRKEATARITEEFGGKPVDKEEQSRYYDRIYESGKEVDLQVKDEFGFTKGEARRSLGIRVVPVYAAPQKIFYPPRDYKLIEPLLERIAKESDKSYSKIIKDGTHKYGNWIVYERTDVAKALQDMGFDGIWITEGMGYGRRDHSTLAIWDSTLVKSSIANEGEFNPDDPRLTKSKSGDNCGTGAGGFKEDNTCATGSAAAERRTSSGSQAQTAPANPVELLEAMEAGLRTGAPYLGIEVVEVQNIDAEVMSRTSLTDEEIDIRHKAQATNVFDKPEHMGEARRSLEHYTGSGSEHLNNFLRDAEENEQALQYSAHVEDNIHRQSKNAIGKIANRLNERIEELDNPTEEAINQLAFEVSSELGDDFATIARYGEQLHFAEEAINDLMQGGFGNDYASQLYENGDTLGNAEFSFTDIESVDQLDEWIGTVEEAVGSTYSNSNLFNDAIQYSGLDISSNTEIDAIDAAVNEPLAYDFEKGVEMPVRVFRGISVPNYAMSEMMGNFADIDKDGVFTTDAYASTSLDGYTAKTFALKGKWERRAHVLFDIDAKRGAYLAPISMHSGEEEVLLPRNAKYDILNSKWLYDPKEERVLLYIKAVQQ